MEKTAILEIRIEKINYYGHALRQCHLLKNILDKITEKTIRFKVNKMMKPYISEQALEHR